MRALCLLSSAMTEVQSAEKYLRIILEAVGIFKRSK